jgi:hypothetical protein
MASQIDQRGYRLPGVAALLLLATGTVLALAGAAPSVAIPGTAIPDAPAGRTASSTATARTATPDAITAGRAAPDGATLILGPSRQPARSATDPTQAEPPIGPLALSGPLIHAGLVGLGFAVFGLLVVSVRRRQW